MHFKILLPLLLTLSSCLPVPAQVNENFNDGNFTSNPIWTGATNEFNINSSLQLQTNSTTGGQCHLSTANSNSTIANKEWRIAVKQTFAGSDNNHSRIYLVANDSNLTFLSATSGSMTTGYFLKLGEAGSYDAVKFFRDDGPLGIIELASGSAGMIASSFNINIQVLRNDVGLWSVNIDYSGGSNFIQEISVSDNTYNSSNYFGVSCLYTFSNANKFYFDNIYFGNPIPPPVNNIPNERSVVINEIYADPTPSNGLPDSEYIELLNVDTVPFNLLGWKIVNSTSEKTLPFFQLNPYESVVICDANNTNLFNSAIGISSFTALTNSGDSLTLLGPNSTVVDIVCYSSNWYNNSEKSDGGWSLEQINPHKICSGKMNWSASTSTSGGTPGLPNSIYNNDLDTLPPHLVQWSINQTSQITLEFNETVNESSNNNWICNDLNVSSVSLIANFLTLTFSENFQTEINYTLSQALLSDCEGNSSNFTLDFFIGKTPEIGDLIITEILADPDPVVQGIPAEYIEILNTSSHVLDLRNLAVNSAIFPATNLLQPNEYLIIGDLDESLSFLSVSNKILLSNFPTLTNSGMLVELSLNGNHLDSIRYSIDWFNNTFKANGGWSLELINPYLPCSSSTNWKPCENDHGNTPGFQNSVYSELPDITSPLLNYVSKENDSVVLHFNEPVTLNGNFFQNENEIDSFTITSPSDRIAFYSTALLDTAIFHYTLQGISDCSGNVCNVSFEWGYPLFASSENFIINEILFNPFSGGSDFVEFMNTSSRAVCIQDLVIANGSINSGADSEIATSEGRIVLPNDFVVFTEDKSNLQVHYPTISIEKIIEIKSLPSFNDDSGSCVLYSNQHELIDIIGYTEDMHFQLLSSFEGISLERISNQLPSEQKSNWHSASQASGFATPGLTNSQYQFIEILEGDFTISPKIFSPDNDGNDDNIQFSFSNLKSGCVGNLTIYNGHGIRVRRLMQNEYLGPNGNVIWDGLSDEGAPLEIGIYIATFEAFNEEGIQMRQKKDFILAKKL